MPCGPTELGFVYFAAVKLAGYTGYSALLNRSKAVTRAGCAPPSMWKAGLVRTGIGVVVGVAVGLGFWKLAPHSQFIENNAAPLFFAGLVPVRIAEWSFFLWLLYRRYQLTKAEDFKFTAGGIVVSFLLDVIGVYAFFVLPGGAWIC